MTRQNEFKGGCHCGNVTFSFLTSQTIKDFNVRRCDCTFCTKHGGRYISDPEGELIIRQKDKENTFKYVFGTKTAEFILCKVCGVMPVALSEIQGNLFGIVNVNALDIAEHFGRHAKVVSYDEEELDERLSRRKANWIGKVTLV